MKSGGSSRPSPAREPFSSSRRGCTGVPPEATWEVALAQLAADGTISRDRLLDASLDGLSRDMHDLRARWFAVLHDRLEPTPRGTWPREAARYVDFLGSHNPSTVAFALKVLEEPAGVRRVDSEVLVDRPAPAFHSRTKGTVKQALALLDLAVRRSGDPALKPAPSPSRRRGWFTMRPMCRRRSSTSSNATAIPTTRPLRDLLAVPPRVDRRLASRPARGMARDARRAERGTGRGRPGRSDEPGRRTRPAARGPRRGARGAGGRPRRAIGPPCPDVSTAPRSRGSIRRAGWSRSTTWTPLIELCSRLIENPKPPEDVDRCVDAISRLCDQRPADFEKRTAPLAARLRQRLGAVEQMRAYALHSFGCRPLELADRKSPDRYTRRFDSRRTGRLHVGLASA